MTFTPAAADTIIHFFKDTGEAPENYDKIFTGDLGQVGSELLIKLSRESGLDIAKKHNDCGLLLYDRNSQDVHAGGSGCGCSASVLAAHILPGFDSGVYKKVLFIPTGALLSPTSVMQGENIPSIAHLIELSV